MAGDLLTVDGLVTEFRTDRGTVRAVDDVSFSLQAGQTLGIVGESGCGKSVTALSIMRLVANPPGRVAAGKIMYGQGAAAKDILALPEHEMQGLRGNRIAMIFQEPMTALNPVITVGEQVAESVRLHQKLGRKAAMERAIEMLQKVGIPAPRERARQYPHELSGGMRQRVMIAMALACKPDILIADEPTTALDVTIQAQILELLRSLQAELGMSIMLITHDLGVVAETCERVIVMYAGRVVETAPAAALFAAPHHHYTAGLVRSVPRYSADGSAGTAHKGRLQEIVGMVPPLWDLPVGCKFADRCPAVQEVCRVGEPALVAIGVERTVRCHFPANVTSSAAGPTAERTDAGVPS
ncbi:MAG: ABC transporter ATP-binding protein [Myxococcales bacterium]|nr:ABC transporter ATP-binding protein [Myxococcales bacterium]